MCQTLVLRPTVAKRCIGCFLKLWVAALLALGQAGCGGADLSDYEPRGRSADRDWLASLIYPVGLIAVGAGRFTETEILTDITSQWNDAVRRRPAEPTFRSLCALLNRYFAESDRLIIIERLRFDDNSYDFVVLAQARGEVHVVWDERGPNDDDSFRLRARRIAPDVCQPILAQLDKAREVLPERVFWYSSIDWPLYILHDVQKGGEPFSFGICGWEERDPNMRSAPVRAQLGYARAAEIVRKGPPRAGVRVDSPREKELHSAIGTYALLLVRIWEGAGFKAESCMLGYNEEMEDWMLGAPGGATTRTSK